MKHRFLRLAAFCSLLLLSLPSLTSCVTDADDPADKVVVGDVLPQFSVQAFYGGDFSRSVTVTSESLRGKPSLVMFFVTTCPDCQAQLPAVQRVYEVWREDVNFLCIGRAQGKETVQAYWTENSYTLPVSPQDDNVLFRLFAESGVPRLYLCDSDGVVRNMFTDVSLQSFEQLNSALQALK